MMEDIISGTEKIELSKKINKDAEKFFNLFVAIDDKDRLLAYDKDKLKVINIAIHLLARDKNAGFRIYKIFPLYERQTIKSLLDDIW